jgi:hypothetical protein
MNIKITKVDWIHKLESQAVLPLTYNHEKLSKRLQKGYRAVCFCNGKAVCLAALEDALKAYFGAKEKLVKRCNEAITRLKNDKKGDASHLFFDTDMIFEFINEVTSAAMEKYDGPFTEVVSTPELDFIIKVVLHDEELMKFMQTLPYEMTKKYYIKSKKEGFVVRP